MIDSIPALNSLLRQDVTGLVLSAGWTKASGFNLMVSLPAKSTLDLGNGMRTTPISLGISTNPIELVVMADLTVPMKDSTSLDLDPVYAMNVVSASEWGGPFEIDNLKVGPDSEATFPIKIVVYAQFPGCASPISFALFTPWRLTWVKWLRHRE